MIEKEVRATATRPTTNTASAASTTIDNQYSTRGIQKSIVKIVSHRKRRNAPAKKRSRGSCVLTCEFCRGTYRRCPAQVAKGSRFCSKECYLSWKMWQARNKVEVPA